METFDLCIIGAGSGGLSLAAGAAQMGARVVLIEGGDMGGDCLNTGCVPSKALLSAARHAHGPAEHLSGNDALDQGFRDAKSHVRSVIAAIAPHDSQDRFEGLGVTVIRAWAEFLDPRTILAAGRKITARRIILATGSHPFIPPIPGIDDLPYLTNETIFPLAERPEHLLILGGGPIGLEMAEAHRKLGSAVTVIEAGRCLSRDDPDAAAIVTRALTSIGVSIREGQAVTRLARRPDTQIEAILANGDSIIGSHLLVAAGRVPAVSRLNLQAGAVAFDKKGITVGPNLRSVSNRRVYAMGDVAGGLQFTHLAGADAGVIIRQSLFTLPALRATVVPWVTYTDPELAQVGLTEAEACARHGDKAEVITVPFSGNDRAIAENATLGFLKIVVLKGRPIGATLVGRGAGELIGIWTLAIQQRLKLSAIAGLVLPYPTRAEISKRAAGAYFSPRLFANPWVKRVVRAVNRWLP